MVNRFGFRDNWRYYWRYKPREWVCAALGHRDLREIEHRDLCDRPWHSHTDAELGAVDRFCFWCDSGWLDENGKEI